MRISDSAHTTRPWRIHEITPDFEIEDVWSYRTPGAGPDDFPVMLAALRSSGGPDNYPWPARALFAIRWKLGALFGWDGESAGIDSRVRSLRERLPADLRELPAPEDVKGLPLSTVYELDDEAAQELSNGTVHAVMHLGWVPDDEGDGYHLQMAALVKPNGRFGSLYMAAIKPFRYLIVYPLMTRQWERSWEQRESIHS